MKLSSMVLFVLPADAQPAQIKSEAKQHYAERHGCCVQRSPKLCQSPGAYPQ